MFRTPPKYRKLQLSLEDNVPTQTELRSYLGSSLAQVINDYSHDTTRKFLGVIPPMKGPPEELWISPSDQLIGKVALKPPFTNKFIKACTHQGILELGQGAVLRFEAATEARLREEMQLILEEKRKMFEAEKRRAVEIIIEKTRKECDERIELSRKEFEKKLQTALDEATKKSNKEMQKAVVRERMEVTMQMMKKLRDEVGIVVESLHEEFEKSHRAQRDNMIADFNAIMRRERGKAEATMKTFDQKKADEMLAQRRELEMQNMADAAYILCTERLRCSSEKHTMHQCFEIQMEGLRELFNCTITMATPEKEAEASKEEDKSKRHDYFEVVEIIDKEGKKWIPIQLEPEIPQFDCREEETNSFPIVLSAIDFFPPDHYTDKISEASTQSRKSYDSLPFCYFEEKLYVRSDYRDIEDSSVPQVKKTMMELSDEGARFIMKLKRAKTCSMDKQCRVRDFRNDDCDIKINETNFCHN